MAHPLPREHTRARLVRVAIAGALAAVALASALGPAGAATGTTVVAATVPSSTTLDVTGCPPLDPTRTSFGPVTAGSTSITSADCNVLFGSSNDTATLRTYRPDARGTAMAAQPTTKTEVISENRVLDLDMVTASLGWSVGDGTAPNRLRRTTDGGDNWTTVVPVSNGSFRAVSAPNASDVWAARYNSQTVVRSGDGGSTWTAVSLPAAGDRIFAISALDAANAWAVGDNQGTGVATIWRTTNGGSSWTVATCTPTCTGSAYNDVRFVPGTTVGWAVTAAGEIYATTDGATFALQVNSGNDLQSIDAISTTKALAVGSGGQVFATVNGGGLWSNRTVSHRFLLRDVSYRASGVAWATGDGGTVLRSTNDGVSWSVLPSRAEPTSLAEGEATSDTTWVGAANSEVYVRTSDTASTWQVATTPAPGTNWADADGVDGARLWRVGSRGRVDASTDGTTWTPQSSGTSEALYGVAARSRQLAIAVGSNGTIRRTVDAGATWSTVASGTTNTLRSVALGDAGRVWIVGDAGTILGSIDDGATFTALSIPLTNALTSASAWSATDLLVGSSDSSIRRSTDGGATWSTVTVPGFTYANLALRTVPGTGVAWISANGSVARTTDSGASFTTTSIGPGQLVMDIDAVDATTAWLSGRYGTLRRTTNGTTWTSLTGGTNARSLAGVVALGPDRAVAFGESNTTSSVDPPTGVPDYDGAAASFAGSGFFGVCLRAAPATGSSWPTTGTCAAADGTTWRGLPLHGALASAPVASTLAPGSTTASLRFGLKVPAGLPTGTYTAPVTFEVTAPAG